MVQSQSERGKSDKLQREEAVVVRSEVRVCMKPQTKGLHSNKPSVLIRAAGLCDGHSFDDIHQRY